MRIGNTEEHTAIFPAKTYLPLLFPSPFLSTVILTHEIDYTEHELIAPEVKTCYKIFKELFNSISGSELSNIERKKKNLVSSEFTYGEIEYPYFVALLKMVAKGTGGVFWDLGCGTGKPLIAAALGSHSFSKICGVELLEGLCNAAKKVVEEYIQKAIYNNIDTKERLESLFTVVQNDMLKVDWSDGDVIYAASICFPEELLKALCEKGKLLKKGARIITLKNWEEPKYYKVLHCLRVKMTWGKNRIYILERI